MKLPIPFFLYTVALGLLAWAGWTVYRQWPSWRAEVRTQAHRSGDDEAKEGITRGRAQTPDVSDWSYAPATAGWWAGLKLANLTGKLPPPPPDATAAAGPAKPPAPTLDMRPLDEVIELIALAYDGEHGGKGGYSHVIARFKPEANVEAPEWWLRENQPPSVGGAGAARGPADVTPKAGGRASNAAPTTVPTTPAPGKPMPQRPNMMPVAGTAGLQYIQKIWVDGGGDARRSAVLWPVKSNDGRVLGNVRLVRIAPDAQSAFFVRELPRREGEVPTAPNETAPNETAPKEEELLKTAMGLDQDLLKELRLLQGRAPTASEVRREQSSAAGGSSGWVTNKETQRVNGVWHIGTDDEQRFQENPDRFFEQVSVAPYRKGSVSGVIVRSAESQLSQRFGVTAGDVLIEVNGKRVESQAQAVQQGKSDYQRGVRTFVTKWFSNGQVVERTFQARQ
jgi:hypothetical protein